MGNIHQLVNQNLDHMVEKGTWLGLVNTSLKQNTRWGENAQMLPVPVRKGQDYKIEESENAEPDQDPISPITLAGRTVKDVVYDGLDVDYQKYGYFNIEMNEYSRGTEAFIEDLALSFADASAEKAAWVGQKAGLTRDLQSRRTLTQAYLGGNTYVTTLSLTSVTTLDVKDINGFKEVVINGVPFPVSVTTPLPITITNATLGTVSRQVTGFTEGTRVDGDDTIPGTITISVAVSEIAVGDNIVSSQVSPHNAPGGKSSAFDITGSDVITLNLVMDMLATLQSHGVNPHAGGFYQFMGDTTHQAQFWRDTAFQRAYTGHYGNKEMEQGAKIRMGNIEFDFSHQPAFSTNESGVLVRRSIVTADGALINGFYEKDPKQTYSEVGDSHNHSFDAVNKIHHTIAKNVGAKAKRIIMSYQAYWGFAARQDSLSKFGQYKDARYKRGIGLLTA